MQQKIIHVDCDCYYAALEMRDFPHLRNRPMAVGGSGPRSVLSTCNYEARAYGIHSAMPAGRALALCPQLIIQPSRFDVYRAVSEQILAIYQRYTDLIEPLSLDEAFLDVTGSHWFGGSATLLAEHIRHEIHQETGITASAGVAPNKFLAKVSSDWNKPNGCFVVAPHQVAEFVIELPVNKINGVGKKFNQRLKQFGIETCGDVQKWPLPRLIQYFGKSGLWLHQRARGIDERPVGRDGHRKSLSVERTYSEDLKYSVDRDGHVQALYELLSQRLSKRAYAPIKGIFVKVRFGDFTTTTMERSWALEANSYLKLVESSCSRSSKDIRLLGLGVRFSDSVAETQLSLWPGESLSSDAA